MTLKPTRTPWRDFPPVVIHSPEIAVKRHPDYRAAKSGDVQAAFSLVRTTIAESAVVKIRELVSGRQVILASAHAVERDGVNAIMVKSFPGPLTGWWMTLSGKVAPLRT